MWGPPIWMEGVAGACAPGAGLTGGLSPGPSQACSLHCHLPGARSREPQPAPAPLAWGLELERALCSRLRGEGGGDAGASDP